MPLTVPIEYVEGVDHHVVLVKSSTSSLSVAADDGPTRQGSAAEQRNRGSTLKAGRDPATSLASMWD
jgi:hypothetical protein